MSLIRTVWNYIHGAGSKKLKHPYNYPLDRYTLLEDDSSERKATLTAISNTAFPKASGSQTIVVNLTTTLENVVSYQLLKNGEPSSDGTASTGRFTITFDEESPIEYSVELTTDSGKKVLTNIVLVEYVDVIYYQLIEHEEDILENLNEEYVKANFKTIYAHPKDIKISNINSNYQLFTFITPKDFGENYQKILGSNTSYEWDYTQAFSKIGEVEIDSLTYYVYIIDTQAEYDNYTFNIKF